MHYPARLSRVLLLSIGGLFLAVGPLHAQLNTTFEDLFNQILDVNLSTDIATAGSFDNAAARANASLTPTLNNLIASNVASFPLTSTIAGISLDLSSGVPELYTESLGPIFAETAETVGKGKVSIGFNASYYDLAEFRGLATEDFRFTLTSEDLNQNGTLGDLVLETETMDVFPDLHLDASTFVFYATVGVLHTLDIGVAVPFITLQLEGNARAVINSTTLFNGAEAINIFNEDGINPVLTNTQAYAESTAGLGDVAVRVKYVFSRAQDVDVAAFVEVRLPTGDEKNFLGTGKTNARFSGILSSKKGAFAPHLNLGYEYRGADFDSDEIEFNIGFSHQFSDAVTFLFEILGEIDLQEDELTAPLLETETLDVEVPVPSGPPARARLDVALSNLPDQSRDNVFNMSIGGRFAPSNRFTLLANILVPLQDGGLRSRVAPTLGLALNF